MSYRTRSPEMLPEHLRSEIPSLVSDLRKAVTAGTRLESSRLSSLAILPRLRIVVRLANDGRTPQQAARLALSEVIERIGSGEEGNDPPLLSEAYRRLFGFSSRTSGATSPDRQNACRKYYFEDPGKPEFEYCRMSFDAFVRRHYPKLLEQLACELLHHEEAAELEESYDEFERTIADKWFTFHWRTKFFWLFKLRHYFALAGSASLRCWYLKFPDAIDDPPSLSFNVDFSQLLFSVACIWRTYRKFEEYTHEDFECDFLVVRYLHKLLDGEEFRSVFMFSEPDQARLDYEIDSGVKVYELAHKLRGDSEGRLLLRRFGLVIEVCTCLRRGLDWNEEGCPLHALGRHSRKIYKTLDGAWAGFVGNELLSPLFVRDGDWFSQVMATGESWDNDYFRTQKTAEFARSERPEDREPGWEDGPSQLREHARRLAEFTARNPISP